MDNPNRKAIKLTAYKIESDELGQTYPAMFKLLKRKLEQKEIADSRRMKLNGKDEEEDLLSDYVLGPGFIFCVMWRLSPTKDLPRVPRKFFSHPTITRSELGSTGKGKAGEDADGISCKSANYFALNQSHIVSTIPSSRIRSLEVYLDWLLSPYMTEERRFRFIPVVRPVAGTKLKDIKRILIGGNSLLPNAGPSGEDSKVLEIGKDRLRSLLTDNDNLKDLLDRNLLTAELTIKIRRATKKDQSAVEKVLGTALRPISEQEDITLELKNKRKVRGSEIMVSKIAEVGKSAEGLLDEQDISRSMQLFLKEL